MRGHFPENNKFEFERITRKIHISVIPFNSIVFFSIIVAIECDTLCSLSSKLNAGELLAFKDVVFKDRVSDIHLEGSKKSNWRQTDRDNVSEKIKHRQFLFLDNGNVPTIGKFRALTELMNRDQDVSTRFADWLSASQECIATATRLSHPRTPEQHEEVTESLIKIGIALCKSKAQIEMLKEYIKVAMDQGHAERLIVQQIMQCAKADTTLDPIQRELFNRLMNVDDSFQFCSILVDVVRHAIHPALDVAAAECRSILARPFFEGDEGDETIRWELTFCNCDYNDFLYLYHGDTNVERVSNFPPVDGNTLQYSIAASTLFNARSPIEKFEFRCASVSRF